MTEALEHQKKQCEMKLKDATLDSLIALTNNRNILTN